MRRNSSADKYLWAAPIARAAMGKKKVWGGKDEWIANDDPLAWWLLTEIIADGYAGRKQ